MAMKFELNCHFLFHRNKQNWLPSLILPGEMNIRTFWIVCSQTNNRTIKQWTHMFYGIIVVRLMQKPFLCKKKISNASSNSVWLRTYVCVYRRKNDIENWTKTTAAEAVAVLATLLKMQRRKKLLFAKKNETNSLGSMMD